METPTLNALVIAPHPDDEVLGVGGTVSRLVGEGWSVDVCVVTKGEPNLFDPLLIGQVRMEARAVHSLLEVRHSIYLDMPAARLDTLEHNALNAALLGVIRDCAPQRVFLPFPGDLHMDHRLVFDSAMVGLRPVMAHGVESVVCYETLSETAYGEISLRRPFSPNMWVDITKQLQIKLGAVSAYASQMYQPPNERSVEAVEQLARLRGATIGVRAAEAFVQIWRVE